MQQKSGEDFESTLEDSKFARLVVLEFAKAANACAQTAERALASMNERLAAACIKYSADAAKAARQMARFADNFPDAGEAAALATAAEKNVLSSWLDLQARKPSGKPRLRIVPKPGE